MNCEAPQNRILSCRQIKEPDASLTVSNPSAFPKVWGESPRAFFARRTGFAHAVLLKDEDGYYCELHGGHAGNCCCNQHEDYIWREDTPYTYPDVIDEIGGEK